jgi:hypothetical protein
METQPAHALAQSLHIPFLAIRAISDTAAEPLDPEFLKLVDPQGHPRISHALLHLAQHPAKLPSLLRIRRASNLALEHLAATIVAIVSSGWPAPPPSPAHRPCV